MSTTVRTILVFTAAAIAFLAAAPPVDLPGWAAGLIAALAAGFAGIGLLPPTWHVTGDGQRAVKKKSLKNKPPSGGGGVGPMGKSRVDDTDTNKVAQISGQSLPRASHHGGRHTSFAIVLVALLAFLVPTFAPTSAGAAPSLVQTAPHVTKSTVLDLGKLGKYRVTNGTLNGQPAIRAAKITKKAHAAALYLHSQNAGMFCQAWNNQSATDSIRYVEASLSGPAYSLYVWVYQNTRYSNTRLDVYLQWKEWPNLNPFLAINYGCQVTGSDDNMWMLSVGGSTVYWGYN